MAVGEFVGYAIFSASLFFFLLGFTFSMCGYFTGWLVPRTEYVEATNRIDSVGLRQVCFTNFQFEDYHDVEGNVFDGCYDNSRKSARFNSIDEDVWSPDWFQTIQNMHLASVLILVITMLLIGGFVAMFCLVRRHERKYNQMPPGLSVAQAGLGLWFILVLVIGIILVAEAGVFYHQYDTNSNTFYYSRLPFNYGPGFGLTIGAGISLLISAGASMAVFCILVMKIMRNTLQGGDGRRKGEDYDSQEESHQSFSDHHSGRHSVGDTVSYRRDPDGLDETEIHNHQQDSYRNSYDDDSHSGNKGAMTPDGRPVPAPRSRPASAVPSREPSVARSSAPEYNNLSPSYDSYRVATGDPPEKMRLSERDHPPPTRSGHSPHRQHYSPPRQHHSPPRQFISPQRQHSEPPRMMYDFSPGHGYVPKSARTVSDTESRSSYQGYKPQRGYSGSSPAPSDTESQRGERNRSVSRSSAHRYPDIPEQPQKPPTKTKTPDPKSSRYATNW